jgi:triphosphoribosyl-dephospho-CoA synthase
VKKALHDVTHKTTVKDAVNVAKAIQASGAYVGIPQKGPDIRNETAIKEIDDEELTLIDLFLLSSEWDTIAAEWVHGFPVTLSGAGYLVEGKSILGLYMDILSEYPDSLVQRRFGKKIAIKISKKAQKLKNSSDTELKKWDSHLYRKGINPGTTADLVASSLFVALLQKEDLLNRFVDEIRTGIWVDIIKQ